MERQSRQNSETTSKLKCEGSPKTLVKRSCKRSPKRSVKRSCKRSPKRSVKRSCKRSPKRSVKRSCKRSPKRCRLWSVANEFKGQTGYTCVSEPYFFSMEASIEFVEHVLTEVLTELVNGLPSPSR